MRVIPRSLFGRTLLVLALGLVLTQVISFVVNAFDRGSSVYRLAANQMSVRIAEIARTLNRIAPAQRITVMEEVNGRDLRVTLALKRIEVAKGFAELNSYEKAFAASIQRNLGAPWPTEVEITTRIRPRKAAPDDDDTGTPMQQWFARNFYFMLPATFSLVAQVGLEDGTTAVFFARVPQEPLRRLEILIPRLLLTLLIFIALAALVVRMMTRSLQHLARAADEIGTNPEGPPLQEEGPSEVRVVISAFNRMRAQVRRHVNERARLLSAISHDLKTPITRMRLRAEMLADADLRAKMVKDLDEMDTMVSSTLEFFKSLGTEPELLPVDVGALIDSLCEDWRDTGHEVIVSGAPRGSFDAQPTALRRCLDNLIANAVRYGERPEIAIDDDGVVLRISVRDHGPGIPDEDLERVFEPFTRLEASRNRASGGAGLGLSIALNIARWHGGAIVLRSAEGGGLVAELSLPRRVAQVSAAR